MNEVNKKTMSVFINENGELEIDDGSPKLTTEEYKQKQRARKSFSARCGHIKRRLNSNEPLTGKSLELALELAGDDSDLARKLMTGETLSSYEHHLFVDVVLLHARLSGG